MKLVLTALIDFNDHQKSHQDSDDVTLSYNDDSRSLINPQKLINQLRSSTNDHSVDLDRYRKGLIFATLRFRDLSFRHRYFDWIYSRYSKSPTNRRRIQENERMVLVEWSRKFNRRHSCLKILKIKPEVNNDEFMAQLTLISISQQFGSVSFSFRKALEAEYKQNYDQAFIRLERDEGRHLAKILENTFVQYVPDGDFQFINRPLTSQTIDKLKPIKFNPDWIDRQRRKSAAASQERLNRIQKMYNSALTSADSQSVSDSQMISKLNRQLSSASSYNVSLNAARSQVVSNLHNQINAFNSNKSSANHTVDEHTELLRSQLSRAKSCAIKYSSSASQAMSLLAGASKQSMELSSAEANRRIFQFQLTSQLASNLQLRSQIQSLKDDLHTDGPSRSLSKRSFKYKSSMSSYKASPYASEASTGSSSNGSNTVTSNESHVPNNSLEFTYSKNIRLSNSNDYSFNKNQSVSSKPVSINNDHTNTDHSLRKRVRWIVISKKNYLPMIIFISFIVILLLIFIFSLLNV